MAFWVGILYLSSVAQALLSFMSQTEEAFFSKILISTQSGVPSKMSTNQTSQIRKEFVVFQVCLNIGMGCLLKPCMLSVKGQPDDTCQRRLTRSKQPTESRSGGLVGMRWFGVWCLQSAQQYQARSRSRLCGRGAVSTLYCRHHCSPWYVQAPTGYDNPFDLPGGYSVSKGSMIQNCHSLQHSRHPVIP